MSGARWLLAAALAAAAAPQEREADPAREMVARTQLELPGGGQVSLQYRTIVWSAERVRRMRQEPLIRDQTNQRLPVALQSELRLPIPVALGGRRLEPGSYRIGLAMDAAGAHRLSVLIGPETVLFDADLSESRQTFPYLSFCLVPAEEGLFALVFQWGSEHGRVVFERAA